MNFLAHVYLSGSNDHIQIGNLVADWIKGSEYKKYPLDIQTGITMHRFIDSFTDNHPIAKKSKIPLSDKYHKYSGVIIDIVYDHFLAKHWPDYSNIALHQFTHNLTNNIRENMHFFAPEVQEFFPRFMKHRWLESYVTLEGIEKVLTGMSKHTSLPDKTTEAILIIEQNYETLRNDFLDFFPQLIEQIETKFGIKVK